MNILKQENKQYISEKYLHLARADKQLWYYVFGIHDVGQNQVFMNMYFELTDKR
ncbi:hypothetical protein L9F63_027507, partial [Diploptera punctata]